MHIFIPNVQRVQCTQSVHLQRLKENAGNEQNLFCLSYQLFIIHYGSHLTYARTHMHTLTNPHWCARGKHLHPRQCYWKHRMALNGWHSGLPAKVPLLRHSLMRLARRTWKALVISWFMKLSLLRTLATIIRRSNTSSSSAMVATCIRSPRPSSRLPVYRYWSTAWEQSKI